MSYPDWETDHPSDLINTQNAKLKYIAKISMDEWELQEESDQQRLDALGGTFWLSNDVRDVWSLIKVTVDAAGPNESNPVRFATEKRAKDYVAFLQQQNYLEF